MQNLDKDDALNLLDRVKDHITKAEEKHAFTVFGDRESARENYEVAVVYYQTAKNFQKIDELYDKLSENINENFGALVKIAEANPKKAQERLTFLVKKMLARTDEDHFCESPGFDWFYRKHKKSPLDLTEEEESQLTRLTAKGIPDHEVKQKDDNNFKLIWAQEHVENDPENAYKMFRRLKHEGPEVLQAAKNWICKAEKGSFTERDVPFETLTKKELRAIYDDMSLDHKVEIAEKLKNKDELLKLAKVMYAQEHNLEGVYRTWIHAGGKQDDPFVVELREKIFEHERTKYGRPSRMISTFWLDNKDIAGHIQIYDKVIETHPRTAYELAKEIKDEDRMQRAREQMLVVNDSSACLKAFVSFKDPLGIELAMDAFEAKYGVKREDLAPYLEKRKD